MNIGRHQTNERTSKVVVHNNVAYLCGQVAADADADGEMMETGYEVGCEVQYFKDKFTWPATADKVTRSQGEHPC